MTMLLTATEARQAARWAAQTALRDEQRYARRHLGQTGKHAPRDVDVLRQGERQITHVLIHHLADFALSDALWDALLGLLVGDRIPLAQRTALLAPFCAYCEHLVEHSQ